MADLTTEEVFGKPTAATSDEGMSTEDVFGTPPASKPASAGSQLKKGFENVAAVTDMVLGLPGQALMVGADIGGRLKATVQGGSRRDAEFAGKALAGMVPQGLTAPIQTLMEAVGYKGGYQGSDVSRVMESAMGLIHRGGEWVDRKTGGVVSTADVESLVNTALLAAGGRGTAAGIDPRLARMGRAPIPEGQFEGGYRGKFSDEPRKAREAADELQRAEAEAAGLEAAPIETPSGRMIPKVDQPVPQAARSLTEERAFQQQEARVRAQKRADVRAAFADEPGQADIDAAYAARQDELRAEARALPPEEGRTRPPEKTLQDDLPKTLEANEFGDLSVTGPTPLDTGLAKISRGRAFDMDAQELAAVNASKRGGGPSKIEMGGVDQDLANRIAVIGGGAALTAYLSSPENKVENAGLAAAIGGLALYAKSHSPAVADWAQSAGRGAEYGLGMVSTRVGNMSKPLLHRMREHERRVLTSTHENLNAVAPFVERLRKVPTPLREELNTAILTNDSTRIIKALGKTGDPEIVREWKNVRALLETTGQDLVKTGKIKGMLPDYYPRMVVDVPGLLKALGTEERSFLQKRLDEASREAMLKSGRDLTPLETSNIINKVLKSSPSGGKPGFLKGRSVGEVTKELAPFYAPATESLPLYLRAVSRELERARFFGDDLVRPSEGGPANVDLSIGNVVNRERLAGRITDEQVDDLRSMLTSRFGPGERASSGPIQTFKNLTNAGLLGHFTSAVVQAGDIALSAAANGLLPTVKALQQTITRNPAKIDVRDLGLVNHITEEITGGSKKPLTVGNVQISSAKFLDKVFKYSGFSLVDQLGKTTSINAAAIKFRDLAKTEKGVAKIKEKYGEAYGPEFDDLVADLRSGELTDNVKGMLFSELSDIQPISKLEVPQAYLDMPNGRVVYMLKTYMLKQADIVRRNVIQEVKKGNYGKATDSALRFGLALGISGATTEFIRNWMLGRDDKLEWGDIPENIMKTYAWSQYVVDKARRGEPIEAFGGALIPPYQMYDEIAAKDPKALQYLPVIGRLLYAHGAGGAELTNMKAWERARKEDRLDELTDDEIKARKEEALQRRLERYRQDKP